MREVDPSQWLSQMISKRSHMGQEITATRNRETLYDHLNGIQKVEGSIPFGSTKLR